MLLDVFLTHMSAADRQVDQAARTLDAVDRTVAEGCRLARDVGLDHKADRLAELRTRLEAVAQQVAAVHAALRECRAAVEDIAYGTGPSNVPVKPVLP